MSRTDYMTFTEWLHKASSDGEPLKPTPKRARAWLVGEDPNEYAKKVEEKKNDELGRDG